MASFPQSPPLEPKWPTKMWNTPQAPVHTYLSSHSPSGKLVNTIISSCVYLSSLDLEYSIRTYLDKIAQNLDSEHHHFWTPEIGHIICVSLAHLFTGESNLQRCTKGWLTKVEPIEIEVVCGNPQIRGQNASRKTLLYNPNKSEKCQLTCKGKNNHAWSHHYRMNATQWLEIGNTKMKGQKQIMLISWGNENFKFPSITDTQAHTYIHQSYFKRRKVWTVFQNDRINEQTSQEYKKWTLKHIITSKQ